MSILANDRRETPLYESLRRTAPAAGQALEFR